MTKQELITKWEEKHSSLLYEYTDTYKMMTEREISEFRSHMKNVLEFIDDLKQLNGETRKDSVKKCHQSFCPYDNSMLMDRNLCEMEKCKFWW